MNKETFLRIFGEIDETYIQRANEDVNLWQRSQEGVVFRPDSPRKFHWRAVIASVVCVAVVFGVFAFLLNVRRIDVLSSRIRIPEHLSSVTIPFDIERWENPKDIAKFMAKEDAIYLSFSKCDVGSALVEFHRNSYEGPVDASLIIPGPKKFSPTGTTSRGVQKGEIYYITISTYDDYIETIGDFTIWF